MYVEHATPLETMLLLADPALTEIKEERRSQPPAMPQ
jgi:hypothetical protein